MSWRTGFMGVMIRPGIIPTVDWWWAKSLTSPDTFQRLNEWIYTALTCFNHCKWCRILSINSITHLVNCWTLYPFILHLLLVLLWDCRNLRSPCPTLSFLPRSLRRKKTTWGRRRDMKIQQPFIHVIHVHTQKRDVHIGMQILASSQWSEGSDLERTGYPKITS